MSWMKMKASVSALGWSPVYTSTRYTITVKYETVVRDIGDWANRTWQWLLPGSHHWKFSPHITVFFASAQPSIDAEVQNFIRKQVFHLDLEHWLKWGERQHAIWIILFQWTILNWCLDQFFQYEFCRVRLFFCLIPNESKKEHCLIDVWLRCTMWWNLEFVSVAWLELEGVFLSFAEQTFVGLPSGSIPNQSNMTRCPHVVMTTSCYPNCPVAVYTKNNDTNLHFAWIVIKVYKTNTKV
jgi:hypothetical protein